MLPKRRPARPRPATLFNLRLDGVHDAGLRAAPGGA